MINQNLQLAKKNKADEFYTQLEDIERELKEYRAFFSGKVVYCNCDDAEHSNFVKYFKEHFDELNLKGLLSSGYKITESGVDRSSGDFRSAESIELLKQADVVVTNPPFSLFREYVAQLVNFDKKFLIIGNKIAVCYRDIFPLIKQNKVWTDSNGAMCFSGRKFANTTWYTNIPPKKYMEELILTQEYSPEKYPKYDNYDAIEVSKTALIPKDYFGVMGVPITFFDKYNPAQFELLGFIYEGWLKGRRTYKRLLIRRR